MNRNDDAPRLQRKPKSPFVAMIRVRCPECKKGIVYRRGMEMNRLCPSCGIKFEREPGYFSGATWIAIIFAMPVVLFFMFLYIYFFRDLHPALSGVFAALSFIPFVPIAIRLSRSYWMYLDHMMHPQRRSPGPPDDPGGIESTPPSTAPVHGQIMQTPDLEESEKKREMSEANEYSESGDAVPA